MQNLSHLIKSFLIAGLFLAGFSSHAQTASTTATSSNVSDSVMLWVKDLYEKGVSVGDDSIFISKESALLLKDESYRQLVYPKVYTWEAAVNLIQHQEVKKALWYMINLYSMNDQNKELVIKSILIYDRIFKMDKVLVSTFYTYCLTDPEIGKIENGHSEVTAPQVMEKKLNSLKEMIFYLTKYRPANKKEDTTSIK